MTTTESQKSKADLARIRAMWPQAIVVGDDWDWGGVRRAVTDVPRECGATIAVHGIAWRLNGPTAAASLGVA